MIPLLVHRHDALDPLSIGKWSVAISKLVFHLTPLRVAVVVVRILL
jgi:hypothetical protein